MKTRIHPSHEVNRLRLAIRLTDVLDAINWDGKRVLTDDEWAMAYQLVCSDCQPHPDTQALVYELMAERLFQRTRARLRGTA